MNGTQRGKLQANLCLTSNAEQLAVTMCFQEEAVLNSPLLSPSLLTELRRLL